MSVRAQVEMVFRDVAGEHDRMIVTPLRDDLDLGGVGLDSMCYVHVVARLEGILGVDPFETGVAFPDTVGEFMRVYESALADHP